MFRPLSRICLLLALLIVGSGCNSSAVKDALDVVDGVPRKTIDTSKLGVNAFFNDGRFGTMEAQYHEIQSTLRLNYVRVLFAWNDAVQPSPSSAINFSFYDDILNIAPSGVDVLVLITGAPSWMNDPANWSTGNPRTTFAQKFVRRVVKRYAAYPNIIGWEMWNEPNNPSFAENNTMQVLANPGNYVELLVAAYNEAKQAAPNKLVLSAATTAINQNYSETLDYNKAMRDDGARDFADVWAIHYYGKQFENVVVDGGVEDFLNGLGKPVWVTESGVQGFNSQLAYGEQVWPFLHDRVSAIDRIYIYQFVEATPAASTYGLRNLAPGEELSDLYVWLRDRK